MLQQEPQNISLKAASGVVSLVFKQQKTLFFLVLLLLLVKPWHLCFPAWRSLCKLQQLARSVSPPSPAVSLTPAHFASAAAQICFGFQLQSRLRPVLSSLGSSSLSATLPTWALQLARTAMGSGCISQLTASKACTSTTTITCLTEDGFSRQAWMMMTKLPWWETSGTVLMTRSVQSGKPGDGKWGQPGHQAQDGGRMEKLCWSTT